MGVCRWKWCQFPVDKNDFSVTVNGTKINFDVVFQCHSRNARRRWFDASVFRIIEHPTTSCDYYQAALTFNKRDMLSVLKPYGIKTAESYYLNLGDINVDAILTKVGLPCFVKPNKSGSSFGISKVKTRRISSSYWKRLQRGWRNHHRSFLTEQKFQLESLIIKELLQFYQLPKSYPKMIFLITKRNI